MIEYNIKNVTRKVTSQYLQAGDVTIDQYIILDVKTLPYSEKTKIVYLTSEFCEELQELDYEIECKIVDSSELFEVMATPKSIKVTIEIN